MKFRHTVLYSILTAFAFSAATVQTCDAAAASEEETPLRSYHGKCLAQLNSEEVLRMADTLAMQAKKAGDNHYLIMAAFLRLDYYYFQGEKDNILNYVEEVKRLSRQYNEPEYYYFAWGSRLIMFYLKNGMTNHALLEAQNMLREAQAEGFQKGLVECYKTLGNIYSIQSTPELAAEYYRKAIDQALKYDPEDVNIPVYYSSLSVSELKCNHLAEAEQALDKVETYFGKAGSITPYQQLAIDRGRLQIYIKKGDTEAAKRVFNRIENIFARNKDFSIHNTALNEARMDYYTHSKQYGKALAVIDSIRQSTVPTVETRTKLLSKQGDICWATNDRASAAEYYREYILLTDSIRRIAAQNSVNEIAGLLNLQQLEKEKQQLQVDIQHRRLNTTYWAIALLIVALIAGIVITLRLLRFNRQLKQAKLIVTMQNEELQTAKNKAEEASHMKSRFIQDISHEVRTPLNSIVGFSQVVSSLCSEPEAKEYASIIEMNSDNLLRLFNDVLELSSLDELDKLSYHTAAELNASCRTAMDQVKQLVPKEVELFYRTSDENLQILTNPAYVTRILGCVLHNAIKFTEKGSITLECRVTREEGVIRYSVTDTGPGIPVEMQEAVFERFRKLNSFSQGTGLGLSVCHTIATKLGGTIGIDSTYTTGSRFVLTLPLVLPENQTA